MGGVQIPDPISEAGRLLEEGRKAAEAAAKAAADSAAAAAAAAASAAREAAILRENAERETAAAAAAAARETEIAAQNVGLAAEKAAQDTGKTLEKAAQDTGNTIEKAAQDTGNTIEKAGQDAGRTLGIAANDTVAQLGRSYADVIQLAGASYHFIENNVQGINKSVVNASDRIQEGKLIDAVWGVIVDPAKSTEQSAAEAVMESSVLNVLASSAAAVYGGPAGAAAYAAWYTYKATNNLAAALKAGAIAWATSSAGKISTSIEGTALDDQARRVVSSAAVGGAAVAASGGSDEQVLAAFGRGAIVGAARETYASVTTKPLEGDPATRPAVLKDTPEVRGAYRTLSNGNIDITSMPAEISHVGLSTSNADPGYFAADETSGIMQDLGKIPYVNAMAYFHDQWMAMTNYKPPILQVTILPAIALTGAGSEGALNGIGTQQVIDDEEQKKQQAKKPD